MLARALKPNCDGLHDVAKQLLIWAFSGKRKFSRDRKEESFGNSYDDYDSSQNNFKRRRTGFSSHKRWGDDGSENNFSRDNFRRSGFGSQKKWDNIRVNKIDWDSLNLKPITKNFYVPHEDVLNRSEGEIKEFFAQHDIKVKGSGCPAPIFSFEEAGYSEKMIKFMRSLNYEDPTPIQSVGWPIALSGRNMVGVARTGSGKTLGFILPAIIHIQHQPKFERGDGPVALVIAPTRELVQQIQGVAAPFARACNMKAVSVYGGASRGTQAMQLQNGTELCIATPGRLLDFLKDGCTNLERCSYLVLDEADRMFDMGFEPQIREIINQIRPDRQVLMWSATWPEEIRQLAEEHLQNYVLLSVGSLELTANPNINQVIHVCSEREKKSLLTEILEEVGTGTKTIIFVGQKQKADMISYWLNSSGYKSGSLHGGKNQKQREFILSKFRNGRTPILVATDVAARGLDVSDIMFVINFDYPNNLEDYVHRIGRTARHNSTGTSHTLFTEEDAGAARNLISVLRDANQNVPPELEELAYSRHPRRNSSRGFGGHYRRRY